MQTQEIAPVLSASLTACPNLYRFIDRSDDARYAAEQIFGVATTSKLLKKLPSGAAGIIRGGAYDGVLVVFTSCRIPKTIVCSSYY